MKTDRIPLKQQKEYWHIISKFTHRTTGKELAVWLKEDIVLEENLNLLPSPHVGHLKTTYNGSSILLQPLWVLTHCAHICCKRSGTLCWPPQEPLSYRHAHIYITKNLSNLNNKFFFIHLASSSLLKKSKYIFLKISAFHVSWLALYLQWRNFLVKLHLCLLTV